MTASAARRVRAIQPGRQTPEASLVVRPGETSARIEWLSREHAILAGEPTPGGGSDTVRSRLVLGPARRRAADGVLIREVLIDGWLVDVEVEAESRAALRDRAGRASSDLARSGPIEIRAELPGRVAHLLVEPGDLVVAGQPVAVIEAMKMLNEVRAPREGRVERVLATVKGSVELGDLLMILR